MHPRVISLRDARRLAVAGQLLALPRPRSIEEVVRGLGEIQMDPISTVARTEHLVLFSRLGARYKVSELEQMLWRERSLFEYVAHILPTSDIAIHRRVMRRYPNGDSARHRYVRGWLEANAGFRRYVLDEIRRRGPLLTRDLEDRSALGWRTGGWNDRGNNTAMMLEVLWRRGEVMIAGRVGQQRLWDLAKRRLPKDPPRLSSSQIAHRMLDRQLRARGIARRGEFGVALDGERPQGWERALSQLIGDGVAVPVRVHGLNGDWLAHADVLADPFRGRTALLSPFDDLISNRTRTEAIFGFSFRVEIYVPPAKRRHGYYVMPILQRERLIGRMEPVFDKRTRVLQLRGIWPEDDAPAEAGPAIAKEVASLARWLQAEHVEPGEVPSIWRKAFSSRIP